MKHDKIKTLYCEFLKDGLTLAVIDGVCYAKYNKLTDRKKVWVYVSPGWECLKKYTINKYRKK